MRRAPCAGNICGGTNSGPRLAFGQPHQIGEPLRHQPGDRPRQLRKPHRRREPARIGQGPGQHQPQRPVAERPAEIPFDIGPRDIDQVGVVDLDRAGGDAGQARQAAVEVVHRLSVRRPALFQHRPDQVDAAARGIVLVAEQHIGRAGRGAEAVMHAGAQDAVGFGDFRPRQLSLRERGLQRASRLRMDWTAQSQHIRTAEILVFRAGRLAESASSGAARNAMTSRHWSTNDVPARHQFAYWREAVCEAVMNVATEDPADRRFFRRHCLRRLWRASLRLLHLQRAPDRAAAVPYRAFEPCALSRQPAAQRHRPHAAGRHALRIAGRRYRHRRRRAAVQRHLPECRRSRHRRDPVSDCCMAARPGCASARSAG